MSAAQGLFRRDRQFDFVVPKIVEGLDLSHGTLLYMEDVSVAFDGFQAIKDLNFYVNAGELRCLIGPNGAGKTTMMDIITGKTRPDSGSAFFGQTIDLLRLSEPEIAELGIGRKFQKPTVFEQHSVFENLELAMAGNKRVWPTLWASLSGEQQDRIHEVLITIGLEDNLQQRAGALSHGQKQWLEIGMVLMQNPQLLLVDEPVAGMTHQEMDRTAELLLSRGARINARNIINSTPLHEAGGKNAAVAALLIAHGADVNVKGHSDDTPLHRADSAAVAEVLIAHGANVHATNRFGETPLHGVYDPAIVDVLVKHWGRRKREG